MRSEPEVKFERGSNVWVWDSTWLPAEVVFFPAMDCASVRLEHGVIFTVAVSSLVARDPVSRGNDIPHPRRGLALGANRSRWPQSEGMIGDHVTDPNRTANAPTGSGPRGLNR